MPRFVLSQDATGDLREVYDYIAADDPAAARRVLDDLRTAMHRLADHPGLGHLREDLADEALRVWTVHSYLVIYRPDQAEVSTSTVMRCPQVRRRACDRGRPPNRNPPGRSPPRRSAVLVAFASLALVARRYVRRRGGGVRQGGVG